MTNQMNSYWFEISNQRENNFKMIDMNRYRFEFHFASIHVNTCKELSEYRSEIFNRHEISY